MTYDCGTLRNVEPERITRRELSQIYYIQQEYELALARMEELELITSAPKSQELKPVVSFGGGGTSDPTADAAVQLVEIRNRLNRYAAEIGALKIRIELWILELDDYLLKLIVRYRCLELLTWDAVAAKIGGGNTADSCRMYFNRAIPLE